jgi:hypothetical protein
MNAEKGREQTSSLREESCDPLDEIIISPLMSKVNPSHRADFAALHDCNSATRARFKPRTVFCGFGLPSLSRIRFRFGADAPSVIRANM